MDAQKWIKKDMARRTEYFNLAGIMLIIFTQLIFTIPCHTQQTAFETPGIQDSLPVFYKKMAARQVYPLSWLQGDKGDFSIWRKEARAKVMECLLTPPPAVPFNAVVISEQDRGSYVARKIVFNVTGDSRVLAFMLVPKTPGPHPGVLLLHDHGGKFDIGKEKVIEPWDEPAEKMLSARNWVNKYYGGRFIGDELAKKGYVCFSVDMLNWSERGGAGADGQQALASNLFNLGASFAGLIAHEDLRAAEFLSEQPEIDPKRIAAMGLSVGGFRTWQVAALSDHIAAGVSVCWMSTYNGLMVPGNNHANGQSAFTMIHPGLSHYLDYPDVASIACPKPMMFCCGSRDGLFPLATIQEAFAKMRKVWESQQAGDNLVTKLYDAPHEYNLDMQKDAFLWLDKVIGQKSNDPDNSVAELTLEEQGFAELKMLESMYSSKEEWEKRKPALREDILKGINLSPLPGRTPLNAVIGKKRIHDGYSVENVYFESIPGFYVCGNLYRPLDDSKKHPVVLCPHGHFQGDSLGAWGRFRPDQQKRCATLARMGAVVFSYSMFGWAGEHAKELDQGAIIEKPDTANIRKNHSVPLAITMQTWNSMRAIDFLENLKDVDPAKIAVTGASGGGTQTFLLAALDDRVSVSVPVVMVSCYFKDLCVCEKVMPTHEGSEQILNMAEFAAMMAPKPMLLVSDGTDWTRNTPKAEYPFIKRTYSFYNAENNVENAHFPLGLHDYGFEKRVPVYSFLAKHLGLDLSAVKDRDGKIDESKSDLESAKTMLVFSTEKPLPKNTLKGMIAIEEELKKLQ